MREKDFELLPVLQGCQKGNRNSQRRLYEHFHGYALSICLRYSKGREEAVQSVAVLQNSHDTVFHTRAI